MKKLISLFIAFASFAAAQEYTYTFTAPAGTTSCQNYNANQSVYTPENCAILNGFVSPDSLYQASYQLGQSIQWLRIRNSAGEQQAVETDNMVWSGPTDNLTPGVSYFYSMIANITQVCTAPSFECVAASGQVNLSANWSYKIVLGHAGPGCKVGCAKYIRVWTTDTDLVAEGQSTVAILDRIKLWLKEIFA